MITLVPSRIPHARRVLVHPRRHRWPRRLAAMLGRLPDALLARLAGVSYQTVVAERRRRTVAPFAPRRTPVRWTHAMIGHLGTDSDRNVAELLGVGHRSVFRKRRALGIAPYRPPISRPAHFHWSSEALGLLGRASDRGVARELGVTATAVYMKRLELGIPPYAAAPRRISWTRAMIALLGDLPDVEVARRLGVGKETVRRKREELEIDREQRSKPIVRTTALRGALALPNREALPRLGISESTARKMRRELGMATPDGRNWRWTPEVLAKLGQQSDSVVARELGVHRETVGSKRRALAIHAKYPRHIWTRRDCALLGRMSDRAVARRLGVSLKAVVLKRRMLRRRNRRSR
jgi:hypothetical protein